MNYVLKIFKNEYVLKRYVPSFVVVKKTHCLLTSTKRYTCVMNLENIRVRFFQNNMKITTMEGS